MIKDPQIVVAENVITIQQTDEEKFQQFQQWQEYQQFLKWKEIQNGRDLTTQQQPQPASTSPSMTPQPRFDQATQPVQSQTPYPTQNQPQNPSNTTPATMTRTTATTTATTPSRNSRSNNNKRSSTRGCGILECMSGTTSTLQRIDTQQKSVTSEYGKLKSAWETTSSNLSHAMRACHACQGALNKMQ